jgi:hypothetical protein
MTAQLSQPTLGLLRRVLEGMEPSYAIALSERKKFWKDQLFDFGFAPRIIEVAVSYEFRWGDIISDLFIGKFGPQNQHFSDALPSYFCEQTLMRLFALALHEGKDPILLNQLAASLKRDGVEVTWTEPPQEALREPETPTQSVSSEGGDAMQPVKVLNEAIKAVPAVKYALGIGGVIAVIAIAKSFGIDYRVAVFGVVIMLVLMTMLVIFARLAAKRESDFHLQAVIFTWFALVLTMATAVMLFSSVFWGQPLDLRYKGEPPSSSTTASITAPKNEAIPPIAKGGAPVGAKYQYTYKKNDLDCTGEYVKVSTTDWQQRLSSESPAGCRVEFVVFTFTERESSDQHYFLLYDASRNLFARLTDTEKGQQSPNEWRLVSDKTWNQTYALTRVN